MTDKWNEKSHQQVTYFLNASWLICWFTVILWHIERKWLLKKNLATILPLKFKLSGKFQRFNATDGNIEMTKSSRISTKFQLKWKILKHFTSPKQRSAWRKLFSPLPDKSFLCLWNKDFRTEIYRNIQTFAFQVPRACSSWASRNSAEQMFFLISTRKMFLTVLPQYIFYVEWVGVRKMSEAFWAKLHFKMSDLFC